MTISDVVVHLDKPPPPKGSALLVHLAGRYDMRLVLTQIAPFYSCDPGLLLKRIEDRQVPGIVGQKSVPVFQAISSEGFPKDIILW